MSYRVRIASPEDIPSIQRLLRHYAGMGELLPRTKSEIITNLEHFRVVDDGESILACGSLEHFTDELAEIRSLMVNINNKGQGLGRLLVDNLIGIAKKRKVRRLMALTYVPQFFHKLGFKTVDKDIFPEKVWGICINCYKFHNCDEIAVLLELN